MTVISSRAILLAICVMIIGAIVLHSIQAVVDKYFVYLMIRQKVRKAPFCRTGEGGPSPANWSKSSWFHPHPQPAHTARRLDGATFCRSIYFIITTLIFIYCEVSAVLFLIGKKEFLKKFDAIFPTVDGVVYAITGIGGFLFLILAIAIYLFKLH